jgi:hypothetical protein
MALYEATTGNDCTSAAKPLALGISLARFANAFHFFIIFKYSKNCFRMKLILKMGAFHFLAQVEQSERGHRLRFPLKQWHQLIL